MAPRRTPTRPGVMERATQILDAFADGPDELRLEDVCHITGLPRSSAFRLLGQLVDLGWMDHDARGYRLGPRMRVAGSDWTERLRAAASAPLTELQLATDAVAHLSVLEGDAIRFLDKVGGTATGTVPSRVGARIVATDTVSGRALLAAMTPEQVDRVVSPSRPNPLVEGEPLHVVLTRVRHRNGLSHSTATSNSSGISSLAVPVRGPEGAVAAISVAYRGELPVEKFAPLLTAAARTTGLRLFPPPGAGGGGVTAGSAPPARPRRPASGRTPR